MHEQSRRGVVDRWWGEGTPLALPPPQGKYSVTAGPVNQPCGMLDHQHGGSDPTPAKYQNRFSRSSRRYTCEITAWPPTQEDTLHVGCSSQHRGWPPPWRPVDVATRELPFAHIRMSGSDWPPFSADSVCSQAASPASPPGPQPPGTLSAGGAGSGAGRSWTG